MYPYVESENSKTQGPSDAVADEVKPCQANWELAGCQPCGHVLTRTAQPLDLRLMPRKSTERDVFHTLSITQYSSASDISSTSLL